MEKAKASRQQMYFSTEVASYKRLDNMCELYN